MRRIPHLTMYMFRDWVLREMDRREMSARQFAEFVGVAHTTVAKAINAREPKKPGLEFLIALSRATNTDLGFLVSLAYPEEQRNADLPPDAQAIAKAIQELPDNMRQAVIAIIRGAS